MDLNTAVSDLANTLGLSSLLSRLPAFDLVDHWQQGEFHHDIVVRTRLHQVGPDDVDIVLVVATNCNGGVKEVTAFSEVPDRWSLWNARCPNNTEFASRVGAPLPATHARARTLHWFDPCALLVEDARSELKPGCRRRAVGGGWERE
jgi:hypothetical protein